MSAEARLKDVWASATNIRGRIVEYLAARGLPDNVLDGVGVEVVRFAGAHPYYTPDGEHLGDFPAMVARVTDCDGRHVTLHRTYLSPTGSGKLGLDGLPAKKLMPVIEGMSTAGASIKLHPAGSTLALAEGIETALAVHAATGIPCWSCVNAHGLEMVQIPDAVRTVHIFGDHDESGAGQRAAKALASRLHTEGRTVYLHLPPEAGRDWLDLFDAAGEDALLDEVSKQEVWSPPRQVGIRLSTVKPECVSWLWEGRIPLGKLTVLDGDPGLGKSTVTLDLAARLSSGQPMPGDGESGCQAGVVIVSAEDGLADTIVPRLMAAGADLERISAIETCPDDNGGHPFTLPDDLPHLEVAVREVDAVGGQVHMSFHVRRDV